MGKTKTSKIKKLNKQRTKLTKQGKLKFKRQKKLPLKPTQPPVIPDEEEEEVESDHGEDLISMMESEDIDFLKKAASEGKYTMFQGRTCKNKKKHLKRKSEEDVSDLENEYEKNLAEDENVNKRERLLLPIKTQGRLIKRAIMEEVKDEPEDEELEEEKVNGDESENEMNGGADNIKIEKMERDLSEPVSMAEMLAWREQLISQYKYKIGLLASGVLEDPQRKIQNIARILDICDDWHPELQVTLKKLLFITLMEVFKDILPSYQIKHQDDPSVKLKKDTQELQNYEKSLLKGYRGYLTRLEKFASRLYRKKGDHSSWSKADLVLGELAVGCLCELLKEHPYFNYSTNIVRLVVPYLDNKLASVRQQVAQTVTYVFDQDKKGEVTLEIVRRINHLVKSRKHSVRSEVISVLSSLKIHEVNLEELKEAEIKQKKLEEKKRRVINLSKRERKRKKRIAEVEKELLETKAEENKNTRQSLLTEVTKMVFTVVFRILKSAPSSGLLSAALQVLARFAHCINVEFYQDIVVVLDRLMSDEELKVKEQLNCILTVFKILSGQGDAVMIDPNKFYAHLYRNMLSVNAGRSSENSELLVECIDKVILGRRKKLTHRRLLAFLKRLAVSALYQEQHAILAYFSIIRQSLQNNKSLDVLLDTETGMGGGVYLPELNDPEYSNADSTALYELLLLQRHFHPTVRLFATHIINGVPATGNQTLPMDIVKLSSKEMLKGYDPSQVVFKPAVALPNLNRSKKSAHAHHNRLIKDKELASICDKALQQQYTADFSILFDKKLVVRAKEEDDEEAGIHF